MPTRFLLNQSKSDDGNNYFCSSQHLESDTTWERGKVIGISRKANKGVGSRSTSITIGNFKYLINCDSIQRDDLKLEYDKSVSKMHFKFF